MTTMLRMDLYSYDAAGNLLNDGTHQYFYDAENRLIQVDGTAGTCTSGSTTGTTACYYYDADGRRVYRTGFTQNLGCFHNGQVGYVFDLAGHAIVANNDNDTGCVAELYAGNRHLGTSSNGVNFSHVDWLGTERMQYRDQYNIFTYCTSLPFGDDLTCTGVIDTWDMHFTGKERDFESGLDFFLARHNASNFGRFMSPDEPFVDQERRDPQSWNLYGYVRNNPLNATDPDGNKCVKLDNGTQGDDGTGGGCPAGGVDENGNETPQQVQVNSSPGSLTASFLLNLVFSFSNAANKFFQPVTDAMNIQPSYMQNIPTGSGAAANFGVGVATAATFFIGPEAEGINITVDGLEHVVENHTVGGAVAALGKKSIFNAGEDVQGLIKAAEGVSPIRQATGNFERVVDAGRPIGIDRTTGAPTSTYTVITKPNGDLVTAFPGRP